jgi:ribosome maturation factor RimP
VHFERALGQRVRVRTRDVIGDRRQFRGTLTAVTAVDITVADPDAGTVSVPFGSIERAHVDYDFNRPAGPPHAHA